MRGWLRFGLAAGALILGTGCNGFPRTMPLQQAEMKPEKYPTYTMSQPVQFFVTPGQRWMPLPGAHLFPQAIMLAPLSDNMSRIVWDNSPYDLLFGGQTRMTVYAEVR